MTLEDVRDSNMITDGIKWWPKIEVVKYQPRTMLALARDLGHTPTPDELRALEALGRIEPDEVTMSEGNALTDAGRDRISSLIRGAGGTAFTAATAWCGVGDSNAAFAGNQQNLQAATNKYYKLVTVAPAAGTTGQITSSTDFTGSEANYAWLEWCWGCSSGTITAGTAVPGTGPVMLNRAIPAGGLGTKANGATWTLNASITIT